MSQRPTAQAILPGATIGVLGGGQLGRMMALAARKMGYRVHVFTALTDSPTAQVCDRAQIAPLTDLDALDDFLQRVAVVTFETENIPLEALQHCEARVPTRPSQSLLSTAQDRIHEKTRLAQNGYPVPKFQPIRSDTEAQQAAGGLVGSGVLKTATGGYDGKGQQIVTSASQILTAWRQYQAQRHDAPATEANRSGPEPRMILEELVAFQCELSVVAARSPQGQLVTYGPIQNRHWNHILDVSICPAHVAPQVAAEAVEITRAVAQDFQLEGVFCLEFFLTDDQRLLINEIAPRPHNSGHLTLDAHVTSQFEQQVRGICGLPLGSPAPLRPAAMANLLGDLWTVPTLDWCAALACPDVKLHLYGKLQPRPGRKMGHLTATATTVSEAEQRVLAARETLTAARDQR